MFSIPQLGRPSHSKDRSHTQKDHSDTVADKTWKTHGSGWMMLRSGLSPGMDPEPQGRILWSRNRVEASVEAAKDDPAGHVADGDGWPRIQPDPWKVEKKNESPVAKETVEELINGVKSRVSRPVELNVEMLDAHWTHGMWTHTEAMDPGQDPRKDGRRDMWNREWNGFEELDGHPQAGQERLGCVEKSVHMAHSGKAQQGEHNRRWDK
ncbi:hypothetical protein quinque_003000 [Culex quinquefasciatus]